MTNTLNQNVEYSAKVGGAKNVYSGLTVKTLPTGFNIVLADMPQNGNVLPAGTPLLPDDLNHTAQVHYAFEVYEDAAAAATAYKVKKYGEGTRAKIGMVLIVAPTTVTGTATGVTITAIDSTNEAYDTLTVSATLGAIVAGGVLCEGTAVGASAKIKVLPTTTAFSDYVLAFGNGITVKSADVDAVHFSDGVLYARRVPPIAPCIEDYLYSKGYNVRIFRGK